MLDANRTVADIVTANPECARVLVELRIDFCLDGDRTLEAACAARGIPVDVVLTSLTRAIAARRGPPAVDARTLTTAELISYIVSRHHAYLFAALPFLDDLASRALHEDRSRGGSTDPRLESLCSGVHDLVRRMRAHLYDEEAVLFPALRGTADRRAIGTELAAMTEDHRVVAATLENLRRLAGACAEAFPTSSTLRRLVFELADVEADTMRHIHVETYVLMRRAA